MLLAEADIAWDNCVLRPVIKKHVSFQYWVGWAFFLVATLLGSLGGWSVGRFGFFREYCYIIKRTELAGLLYILLFGACARMRV